jgi:hypothetical protein
MNMKMKRICYPVMVYPVLQIRTESIRDKQGQFIQIPVGVDPLSRKPKTGPKREN